MKGIDEFLVSAEELEFLAQVASRDEPLAGLLRFSCHRCMTSAAKEIDSEQRGWTHFPCSTFS
jgi:hypothetical protein